MMAAPGVVPEAQAVGDARSDGDDVLQRAAHLHPDDVVRGVGAERLGLQRRLDPLGHLLVVRGDGHHRRHPSAISLANEGPESSAMEGWYSSGRQSSSSSRHRHQRLVLDALGHGQERHVLAKVRQRLLDHVAGRVGRRGEHHQLAPRQRLLERERRPDPRRHGDAGEVRPVLAPDVDGVHDLRLAGPGRTSSLRLARMLASAVPNAPRPMTEARMAGPSRGKRPGTLRHRRGRFPGRNPLRGAQASCSRTGTSRRCSRSWRRSPGDVRASPTGACPR